MPLLTTGKPFIRDLEKEGALGVYVPLEGGYEGRYQRRLRAAGYRSVRLMARGLGDIATFLTGIHGVRPHHIGKKDIRTYFIGPIIDTHLTQIPANSKGLVLWITDGHVFNSQELNYLAALPQADTRIKIVVEMGGDRVFSWQPLSGKLVR